MASQSGRCEAQDARIALSEVSELGHSTSVEEVLDSMFASLACHSAVRAGDLISSLEARQLLVDLDAIPYAANCPHGRPVMIRVGRAEVERWFGRDYR